MKTYPDYTFAHIGLNVEDIDAVTHWYVANLDLTIARKPDPNGVFLADPSGRVVVEFYSNPAAPVLDYSNTDSLTLHLAFIVDDPQKTAGKLVNAGARIIDPYKVTTAGDQMVMLRDPFGIPLQFLKRAEPMF